MKCLLGSTTALVGVGVLAGQAGAAEPIKLTVGGFFREAYMVNFDDDREGELGNERNTDGFFNDAEIFFLGTTTLDNGLTIGARVELEGEDNDGDQIDEAWILLSGGFGEVRIGSNDEALVGACILPPGGTDNFSAFSPNQWAANVSPFAPDFPALTSNAVCIGVDDREDAQKIVYMTPVFAGFQLRVSYTPNGGDERHGDGVGTHVGMPVNSDAESRHNTSVYGLYELTRATWALTAGLGASFEGHVEQQPGDDQREQTFYQGGVNLTFGAFSIGGVFEYFDDLLSFKDGDDADGWVAGGGLAYEFADFVLGAQYSHQSTEVDRAGGGRDDFTMDRALLTAIYPLGPGIDLDAEIAYTWLDTDPESGDGIDDYQSLEIGLGTAITF
jgi:outer membrane protein OmpU